MINYTICFYCISGKFLPYLLHGQFSVTGNTLKAIVFRYPLLEKMNDECIKLDWKVQRMHG